jgi:hypothetical protein
MMTHIFLYMLLGLIAFYGLIQSLKSRQEILSLLV